MLACQLGHLLPSTARTCFNKLLALARFLGICLLYINKAVDREDEAHTT